MASLIHEFFEYFHLEFTDSVFAPEINMVRLVLLPHFSFFLTR